MSINIDTKVAELRSRGMNKAADRLVATAAKRPAKTVNEVSLSEFADQKVTITPQTKGFVFEARECQVVVTSVNLSKNTTGSAWLRFELTIVDEENSGMRAFADISLAGGSLETVDVLAFRMTGSRISANIAEPTIADFIAMLMALENETITAWVRQDTLDNGTKLLRSSLTTWKLAK